MNQSSNYDREEKNAEYERCTGFVHVIKNGDTLYKLSKQYNVKVSALILANPYVNIYNLQVGDEICIPRPQPSRPGQVPMTPERPSMPPERPSAPPKRPSAQPERPSAQPERPSAPPERPVAPPEQRTSEDSEMVWEMERQDTNIQKENLQMDMPLNEWLDAWDISYMELETVVDIMKKMKTLF